MNIQGKRILLGQLLRRQLNGLKALKSDRGKFDGVIVVDRIPNQFDDEPVYCSYWLNDSSKHLELLTYTEIIAKSGKVLIIIPDNHRTDESTCLNQSLNQKQMSQSILKSTDSLSM